MTGGFGNTLFGLQVIFINILHFNAESLVPGLLARFGIEIDAEKTDKYYFFTLPDSPKFTYSEDRPDFDKINTTIKYNGVDLISIRQKTAVWDSWVIFSFDESKVDEALAKNATEAEVSKADDSVITEYHGRLKGRLRQLEAIIFEGGASRGYGSFIRAQFPYLLELRRENVEEHDKLIQSNKRYTELYEMFPNWTDPRNLQARYMRMDVSPFMAMASARRDGDYDQEKCCIM